VSKALNGRPDISEATRDRVRDAAASLGYRRPPSATVDATIADQLVDLVLPAIGDSWASALISGVDRVAAENGLDLVVILARTGKSGGRTWVERLVEHRSRGAIVAVLQPTAAERKMLDRAGVKVVYVDPVAVPDRLAPSVGPSNWTGGYDAGNLLLDHGHRRLAVLAGDNVSKNSKERVGGLVAAVRERYPDLVVPVVEGSWIREQAARASYELLRSEVPPTAIFACNDNMAIGVYAAAEQLGLRVPEDLSVIGFDDLIEAQVISPPLTTVRQPVTAMGATALRALLDLRLGLPVARRMELATELVVRASVADAPPLAAALP
jgi:LacI family transcriptional regulator